MHRSMNSDRFTLLPIGYVALVLVVTNLIGYILVTHLERCGYSRSTDCSFIDLISTYICFGVSFLFVTAPTIAAPASPIKKASAVLIFLWSMLYMVSLYYGVYDTLSVTNEAEWLRRVALSFLYLLPHAMGLTEIRPKTIDSSIFGIYVSMVGLMMLSLSSWRTWKHSRHHRGDVEPALSSSIDSWWGNCVFWFGIFLSVHLTSPYQVTTRQCSHSRFTSPPPLWIVSFLLGPGLLLFSHPHIQSFLFDEFLSSLGGIQPPSNYVFGVLSVDPTLLRFVRLRQGQKSKVVEPLFVDEGPQVPTVETICSVDSRLTKDQLEFSSDDNVCCDVESNGALEKIRISDVPKIAQMHDHPMIKSTFVLVSDVEIKSERPVVFRHEKPANSFTLFLSKFTLKITSDVLSGHWN